MADLNLQMQIDARRNNNESSTKYGRIYPVLYKRGTLSTAGLVKHMADHGSLVTSEVLALVLAQLKKCIPELVSQGYGVVLEGLGEFYPSIKCAQNAGKSDVETFIATPCEDMIKGVALPSHRRRRAEALLEVLQGAVLVPQGRLREGEHGRGPADAQAHHLG